MRPSLQYTITAAAFLGALVLGYFGRDVIQPLNRNTTVNVSTNTQPGEKTYTLGELYSKGIDIDTEMVSAQYRKNQACYSGFPLVGAGSDQQMNIADLQVLTHVSANAYTLPPTFLSEIQNKFDAGWNLTTFCVNGDSRTNPKIYFSMVYTGTGQIVTRLRAPASSPNGAPSLIGFWDASESGKTYTSISFSEPIRLMGMGDITYFYRLDLVSTPTTSGVSGQQVIGYSGGGDGPFGWSLKVGFSPKQEQLSILQYCSFDSSTEKSKNVCSPLIQ